MSKKETINKILCLTCSYKDPKKQEKWCGTIYYHCLALGFSVRSMKACSKYIMNGEQKIIEEFIAFLERNEMNIIKDIDTIGFIIKGLKKEGFQYILDDKKEWEENR